MKKIAILMCLVQLFLCTSCAWSGVSPTQSIIVQTPTTGGTTAEATVPTTTNTVSSTTTAPPLSLNQYDSYISLFSESVLSEVQVQPVSDEQRQELMAELETILEEKEYSEETDSLIRDTVDMAIECQPAFQMLFAFLNPHDTATYIHKYMLDPLASMVDEIRLCHRDNPEDMRWLHDNYGENATFGGLTDEDDKRIVILVSGYDWCMVTLAHELHHMAVMKEHSDVYPDNAGAHIQLTEGAATLYQLTLLGFYWEYSALPPSWRARYQDPEQTDHYLLICGMHSGHYIKWSSAYFKLLALTDFETMDLFLQPRGDKLIREELVRRYGEDGGAFYDGLLYLRNFDECLESEALFLKMFSSRIEDVSCASEAISYAALYRFYRKVFSNRYMCEEVNAEGAYVPQETEHPLLPLQTFDRRVAEELLKWSCLNTEDASIAGTLSLLAAVSHTPYYHADATTMFNTFYMVVPMENGDLEIGFLSREASCVFKYRYVAAEDKIYFANYVE